MNNKEYEEARIVVDEVKTLLEERMINARNLIAEVSGKDWIEANYKSVAMRNLFLEYAELKDKIKILTEQAKALEPEVMEAMKDQDKVKMEIGTFSIGTRKKYKYPMNVEVAEKVAKELKKAAEEDGTAIATETKVLSYRSA